MQGVPTGRPEAGLRGRACHDRLSRARNNAGAERRLQWEIDISSNWPSPVALQISSGASESVHSEAPDNRGDPMADALALPLAEIVALLGEGKLKARALVEAAIANHERFGGKLMAYSQWAPVHARQCADAADAAFAIGSRAGSLQGIPTSIKDLFAVPGFPTYAGSPKRLPAKFEIDGPVVATLRRQLATVMGKTHMVEFAFGGTGHNAHYGAPYNPWDAPAHRSPGGSSSGAGVSLGEGSALLALGSDPAASVRLPAAMTGNAGLKLTKDRWSSDGIVPLSFTFDTPGILARSMADAAFGFAALEPRPGGSF